MNEVDILSCISENALNLKHSLRVSHRWSSAVYVDISWASTVQSSFLNVRNHKHSCSGTHLCGQNISPTFCVWNIALVFAQVFLVSYMLWEKNVRKARKWKVIFINSVFEKFEHFKIFEKFFQNFQTFKAVIRTLRKVSTIFLIFTEFRLVSLQYTPGMRSQLLSLRPGVLPFREKK